MSYVTNALVVGGRSIAGRAVEDANAWLLNNDERQQQFQLIDMDKAGGTKFFEVDVWACAFNYMPVGLPEFIGPRVSYGSVVFDGESGTEVWADGVRVGRTWYV